MKHVREEEEKREVLIFFFVREECRRMKKVRDFSFK
jgi:hypothetical protein